MKNIVMVCLGNICRSPSAEAVLKYVVKNNGVEDQFFIDSAGTCANHIGENADPRMNKAASARGINLTSIGRQFIVDDLDKFDFIIVMDDSNKENVLKLARNDQDAAKVFKMTDFGSEKVTHDVVPDPYFGGEEGFELVLDLLEDCCSGFYNQKLS